jgi:uncharacterized membrane protein (DUF373 family)
MNIPETGFLHNRPADVWGMFAERYFPALVRLLVALLMIALTLWMAAGIVQFTFGLYKVIDNGWAKLAEHAIINSLIMLAMLEVIRTLQSYLVLGRVRVTFILDTALVVLIGELMGLWFREYAPEKVLLGLGVIVTLAVLRITTARFSPEMNTGSAIAEPGPPATSR